MSANLSTALIKDCNAVCRAADVRRILQCGLACQSNGLLDDARSCYRHVLTLRPKHFDALHMLGVLAIQTGRLAEAVSSIEKALHESPQVAAAHRNYALALKESGRSDEAIGAYSRAIALEPTFAPSFVHLAELLVDVGQPVQALVWCDRGMEYHTRDPFLHLARAVALRRCQRVEEALASCDTAITLQPACVEAWDKRGAALQELGRPEEAIESYTKAVKLRPDFAIARHHAGMAHLQMGQFHTGWEMLEHRDQARRGFGRPRWKPSGHRTRTRVLLHSEQGLGDTIQFARYAQLVADLGAQVTLMVQKPVLGIMQSLGSAITVIADTPNPPLSDCQCPLLSLPYAFRTNLDNIPAQIPYLTAGRPACRRVA
jgi:tetratricopeptide (TPR) repeat protein